jgi:DNA adenine methylase
MSYPGSKAQAGVFQRIIGQMPPHSVYVEPFFGSGQVFWRKRRASRSIVIDKAGACIAKAGAEAGVHAIAGDAISLLPTLALPADAVIYCDPPYLLSTRQGRFYYDHEMDDLAHASLLTLLQRLECRVLISGYPSELYGAALQSWRCIRYRTRTRGRTVTECLWCNFPEPAELHDWCYAGHTFRQRLALKRLSARWMARLEAMPARKRGYVLSWIQQRYFERGGPGTSAEPGVCGCGRVLDGPRHQTPF